MLAGDMLVSVPGSNVHTELRLPSQPIGIAIPADSIPSCIPVSMRRKIFIVNDHMAVGVAGSVLHIGTFVGDLVDKFRDRSRFSRSEIGTFLDQYASSKQGGEVMEQIGILIVVEATDWRGSLTKGLTNHRNIISWRFGRVVTIGSGSGSIIEQVHRIDKGKSGASQPPGGEIRFPEFKTLAQNLQLLAHLYWKEFTSPANIFDAWGGAYDLIYQDSKKVFQYLAEYTIFLRLFDADQAEKGIQLMNVLKYRRHPDFSFIRMMNSRKLDFFGAKDITASDAPITVKLGKDDAMMNSNLHISIIAVGKGSRYLAPIIQIDGLDSSGQSKQTVFTRFNEAGQLWVAFDAKHEEWLEDQCTTYYRRFAASLS